ncbi:YqaJ viral recombinase family protein [Microbacterium sp. YY-01]|uniref:YqaJ viral recombinase family protein n=1 Tax=Microbacterium sp. YY-01 TaxID=3421634 RepID=UPI003D16FCDB
MAVQTYLPQVLIDLEGRAGASDQDREAWLAERRAGITATEVRDLYHGKIRQQDLIDLKLGRKTDTFTGNAYTTWGTVREPVIAEQLRGEGFESESRVFHHPDNSRHLASPDGIQVTWDEALWVLEIKTAGYDLPPGSKALDEKGYVAQVQWVMWVIGAVKCRFVVEERHPEQGAVEGELPFVAGPLHRHWIERDDQLIAELITVADEFLAELDRQREDGPPEIDEEVDTHAVNYLRGLAAEKEGKALKEKSYKALVAAGVSQESPLARVTYSPGKPAGEFTEDVIDLDAAEKALPKEAAQLERAKARVVKLQAAWDQLANGFTKTVTTVTRGTAARVTVTAGKATKEQKK